MEQGHIAAALRLRQKVVDLIPSLEWVWEGFNYLSMRRQYGFGAPQPISVRDIGEYIRLARITHQEDIDEFMYLVDLLDSKWLEIYARDKQ